MINPRKRPLRLRPCLGLHGECGNVAEYRRQSTAYADDKENFHYLCDPCQDEANDYWEEMWREYRASVYC